MKNMVAGLGWMSRDNERSARPMKKITIAVLLVSLLCLAAACLAEDRVYPTNLELIGRAVRQAADSMRIEPPRGSQPLLEITAGQGEDAAWLLESVLKEQLIDLGWQVGTSSPVGDTVAVSGGYLLKLRVAELALRYGRSWRRYLFGSKLVERVARVALYYELIDTSEDRVLVSSDVGGEVVDVVPASKLEMLSSPKYSFASPELEKSQWDRYLEGGLVIAIIGVLVYLFYSNKTAS
jgi:hypothetical protein